MRTAMDYARIGRGRRVTAARMRDLAIVALALVAAVCFQARSAAQSTDPTQVWGPTEDPSGTAGVLKDHVQTGGGYNPHNGNASRSVTDLKVPGAAGAYGLNLTRHWNSTDASLGDGGGNGPGPFAYGGWTHSWNWVAYFDQTIWFCESENGGCTSDRTDTYIIQITYPDGHTGKFSFSRADGWYYPLPPAAPQYSAHGLGYPWPEEFAGHAYEYDHIRGMDPEGNFFWLHRSDGGAVYFVRAGGYYKATRVLDPHGYETTLSYEVSGSANPWELPRLTRVTGHDGRFLAFEWAYLRDQPEPVVEAVHSSAGQTVRYGYTPYEIGSFGVQSALTRVSYMDDLDASGQPIEACYIYNGHVAQDPPYWNGYGGAIRGMGPLLAEARDPRFDGPLTGIRYIFRGGPGGTPLYPLAGDNPQGVSNIDFFHMVPFPVEQEISAYSGEVISTLGIPPNKDPRISPDVGTRTEVRGGGGTRKFYYGSKCGLEPGATYTPGSNGTGFFNPPEAAPGGYRPWQLGKRTEFSDNPSTAPFEFQRHRNGNPVRTFDGRGLLTKVAWLPWIGRISQVQHLDNSTNVYNWTDKGQSADRDQQRIPNVYNHWLFSEKNENNAWTTYTRDLRRRITRIDYHGGTSERFEDYNQFNQFQTHYLPSGGYKKYEYDTRGLLKREWNSADGPENAIIYTHDTMDRVETVSHAWSRAKGAAFSVKMTYNARHQVTKVEYPAQPPIASSPTPSPSIPPSSGELDPEPWHGRRPHEIGPPPTPTPSDS